MSDSNSTEREFVLNKLMRIRYMKNDEQKRMYIKALLSFIMNGNIYSEEVYKMHVINEGNKKLDLPLRQLITNRIEENQDLEQRNLKDYTIDKIIGWSYPTKNGTGYVFYDKNERIIRVGKKVWYINPDINEKVLYEVKELFYEEPNKYQAKIQRNNQTRIVPAYTLELA